MRKIKKDLMEVEIHEDRPALGLAAADAVSKKISDLLQNREYVNIVFAAAPSQNEFLAALAQKNISWDRINAFHMDEYVGVDKDATQLFGNFLKERLFGKVALRNIFYMNGNAADMEEECNRYASLLEQYPTDIVFLGIGENTHVAFNDPHVAFFDDKKDVKIVDLDERNRLQQVDPGDASCFKTLEEVPTHAITLTVPALFRAAYAYAIVPGEKKAEAIYYTLNSEISERYPSTVFRKHDNTILYIDEKSASRL
jgi:glucosamine-6-phosphate deaminase